LLPFGERHDLRHLGTVGEGPALTAVAQTRAFSRSKNFELVGHSYYVIDSLADIEPVIDDINARLARGERP